MKKKFIFYFLMIFVSFSLVLLLLELFLQIKHYAVQRKAINNENFKVSPRIYQPEYGWKLKKNYNYSYIIFDGKIVKKTTNNLGLASNYDLNPNNNNLKILIIGDSFSESLGVNTKYSWPNQLQNLLKINSYTNVDIYNASISGYNLDQYYFRIKEFSQKINPNIIVIGFATATDFYDVGRFENQFIYGDSIGRSYFEIKNEVLLINNELYNIKNIKPKNYFSNVNNKDKFFIILKKFLENSKLYQNLKINSFFINLIIYFNNHELSLWPSNEISIKIKNNETEIKKLNLIEKILDKINNEFGTNSKLYLVHLPNKTEIDEKFWNSTFKKKKNFYDRNEPEKKIINLLKDKNINFIPTIQRARKEHNINNKKIFLKLDGHYNNFGNSLISEIVYEELINAIRK